MTESNYQRLTRSPSAFGVALSSRTSLWLGADHLLCVDTNGYTENYKRFFFRDIQAITVQSSKRRLVWNLVLGFPMALCLVFCHLRTLFQGNPDTQTLILLCLALFVFGIPLLFNNIFGPTCNCQLRTAVQTQELPSLCRVRQTRKALQKLSPLITAVQGQLTAEEISARMRESIQPAAPNPAPPDPGIPPVLS